MLLGRTLSVAMAVAALFALMSCTSSSEPAVSGPGAGDAAQGSGGTSVGGASAGGTMNSGGAFTGGTTSGGGGGSGPSTGGSGPSTGGRADPGGASSTGGSTSSSDAGPTTSPRMAACPPGQTYGNPLPANRSAAPVASGFGFIEGPVWIAEMGRLFFSDMDFGGGDAKGPPSVIRYIDVTAGGTTAAPLVSSGSNGLALANDGRILAATHDTQSLSYFDPRTGTRTDWPLLYQGHHFNSPNDLVIRADGNVYFTDPDWQLGSRTSETGMEGFYRATPTGNVTLIDGGLDKPNGVTLSPDERTLYVGGQSGGIQQLPLDGSGAPGSKSQFAPGSTDGMTVDCAGNVYTTNGSVIVFDPSGTELGRITVGATPSNVAFGGAARKTLFITAGSSLYSIEMNVPGMPY